MFGVIIFGALAGRIGRRIVIAICVVLFSASSPRQPGRHYDPDLLQRKCASSRVSWIGGVMPNVTVLRPHACGNRWTLMFSGYLAVCWRPCSARA